MPRDLPTPPPENLRLAGPAGWIAATLERPAGAARGLVLLLPPHPQNGGTRRNNVVRHGALGALQAGCAALRLDYRGVGESEGRHDQGVGEVDDAAAAFAWLEEQGPVLPAFVWGFSFGARVGLELAGRLGERAVGYLGVAWPTRFYSWPALPIWPRRLEFLAGDRDDFVELERMAAVERHGARVSVVPGADHFFRGRLGEVRAFTAGVLERWLAGEAGPPPE